MSIGQHLYYGHGKLLLTGEYLVLEGAKAVALPTNFGQTMSVSYRRSSTPKLIWKSYDKESKIWFEAEFELWHFGLLTEENKTALYLQKILRQARRQNVHFLRDEVDVLVNCHLEFDLDWGLGSSSSIIYNIAQWAYISAFELNRNVSQGSGYDVACAQAVGPIFYQVKPSGVNWGAIDFSPIFKDKLFFVHLGKKQSSDMEISAFKRIMEEKQISNEKIQAINSISEKILSCVDIGEFEELILEHEQIVASCLNRTPIQRELFTDYPGVVKSLGAWGGDFVLVTTRGSRQDVEQYFTQKGMRDILSYDEMIFQKDHIGFDNSEIEVGFGQLSEV